MSNQQVKDIIELRDEKYGGFENNTEVTERLLEVLEGTRAWQAGEIPRPIRWFLKIVCHKIARLCCGDPTYIDNYDDIAGYSILAGKYMREQNAIDKCGDQADTDR